MAKMGDRIAKVVCKRCGGHHRYRDENGAPADRSERRRAAPTSRRRARARARARRGAVCRRSIPSKPPRTYAPRDELRAGERVAHPTSASASSPARPARARSRSCSQRPARAGLREGDVDAAPPGRCQQLPISDRPPNE
jgi:hypothetical protein